MAKCIFDKMMLIDGAGNFVASKMEELINQDPAKVRDF